MTNTTIRFGTDGWRAIIAEDYTFENVRACAEGVARYLKTGGLARPGPRHRLRHALRLRELRRGLRRGGRGPRHQDATSSTGRRDAGRLPRRAGQEAGGAIVITASHNPAAYNGFKYKPEYAGSASPEVVDALEARIEAGQAEGGPSARAARRGREPSGLVVSASTRARPTTRSVARLIDLDRIRGAGLTHRLRRHARHRRRRTAAPASGGATRVTELRGERNPGLPGHASRPSRSPVTWRSSSEAVSTAAPTSASRRTATPTAWASSTRRAYFVDQLQTFALLCYYLLEYRGERGPMIRSHHEHAHDRPPRRRSTACPCTRRRSGFKYLGPKMMETDAHRRGRGERRLRLRASTCRSATASSPGCSSSTCWRAAARRRRSWSQELYAKVGRALLRPHRRAAAARPARGVAPARRNGRARSPWPGASCSSATALDGYRFEFDGGWLLIRPERHGAPAAHLHRDYGRSAGGAGPDRRGGRSQGCDLTPHPSPDELARGAQRLGLRLPRKILLTSVGPWSCCGGWATWNATRASSLPESSRWMA